MLRSPDCPLKVISLVSKRWCAIVSPVLFRGVVWRLERCDDLLAKPDTDSDPIGSELSNRLNRATSTFNIYRAWRWPLMA
jgi:hypothetical protein